MKKFCTLLLLVLGICSAYARQGAGERKAIDEALSDYRNGHYAAAYETSSALLTADHTLTDGKIRFVQAASAFRLNHKDAERLLHAYIADFPLDDNLSRAYLYAGILSVNQGQYDQAAKLLTQCDLNTLSENDLEDYCYTMANTRLQQENWAAADTFFTILIGRERSYLTEATYYKAYICYQEDEWDEALKGFEKVKNLKPYRETAPFFIMQIYLNQARYQDVLTLAREEEQKEMDTPHRNELLRMQGCAAYELTDYQSAKRYYETFLKTAADFPVADAYRIGMLYFMDRDWEHAVEFLSEATAGSEAIAQNATYHLGICYLSMGNEEMARMSFERASLEDFDPSAKEGALFNYALLCYKTSFSPFNEQINAFERILKEFPESRYADRIYGYLADAFLSGNNYAKALSFINRIITPSPELQRTRVKLLFLLGVDDFNDGVYPGALEYFNASVKAATALKEDSPETYFWRGETLYRMNRLKEARNDFNRFLSSKQANQFKAWPLAHYDMGYCCFNLGDYDQAEAWFKKYTDMESVRSDATYADALNRLGDCCFQTRRYTQAADWYLQTDRLTPSGNDYAVLRRAFCLGLQKQYNEKAQLLETFSERFPASELADDARYEEGQAYLALGEKTKAIASLEKLIKDYPNSPLSRKASIQTALTYYQIGETDKAVAAYRQVISRYPGSEEATTALNDLKSVCVATNRVQEYLDYVAALGTGYTIQVEEQDSLLYSAAERLMMDGKQTEAAQAFKHYLSQYPEGHYAPDANYHCGSLLNALGFKDEAVGYLKAVLPLSGNPYIVPSLTILSENAYRDGQYTEALAYYRQLVPLAAERELRIGAKTGVMRCLALLGQTESLLDAANALLQEKNLSPEVAREARYHKVMSLIQADRTDEAVKDLEILSKESQTPYGAEARYRLAQYRFDKGENEKAISLANAFLHDGTPQAYWLARTFILLADVYMRQGDDFQAKQYLLSLKENYGPADDDIAALIAARLKKIDSTQNVQ